MNVSLTPELEQMVQSKVQAGRYGSASEVVFDALRMMDELDRIAVLQRGDLQMKIESGLRSLKNGRFSDGNEFFARMEADLDEEVRAEEERLAAKQGPEP